ncbi:family 43 glycosylhydrolase [Aerococcaceae bacterium zg-ZUI334]|uniref:family 43 glycosylhydrolase n=1 Tax=Aerococcaceae bacterium zg-252 TaxID=2796928 RepID=UPI001B97EFF0|nr:family 43 glycosylhydrolase [Aerococcaceae bacterium zg-ZUI334]
MKQVFNPYLPLDEYVPDGEPHVFGDRIYIYGSHDRANGTSYCEENYVCWSAPVDDLTSWRFEGEIYRKDQDPSNKNHAKNLWAPDVTQGPDGKFYLYYCLSFHPEIGVAVADNPTGPFEFYGHVKYPEHIHNGKKLTEFMPFDPAVLTDDDGRIYLYYGFCPGGEKEMVPPNFTQEELDAMTPQLREKMETIMNIKFGENSMVAELEDDMITLKEIPVPLIPGAKFEKGTTFEGHAFFEASSIRKFDNKYFFVYSNYKSHELCYATSDYPNKDFVFGGTIISNGDIGYKGNQLPVNLIGNNHGGIEHINGQYYIFYHRHTNGTEFSRQGCAEKIILDKNNQIEQVQITSCGLNAGSLLGLGEYPAAIACHITSPTTPVQIDFDNPNLQHQTRIIEPIPGEVYIEDISHNTILGYKYFDFHHISKLVFKMKGIFKGKVLCSLDANFNATIFEYDIHIKDTDWKNFELPIQLNNKNVPLYIKYTGNGNCSLKSIAFH